MQTGDMGTTVLPCPDMEVCRMPTLPENIGAMIQAVKKLGFGVGIHRYRGIHKSIGTRWTIKQYAMPKEKGVSIVRSANNVFVAK